MKFEKAPPWIVELFDEAFAPTRAERRSMFGYPCGFVNGLMACGVFGKTIFVRLGEQEKAQLLSMEGASLFHPGGLRPMSNYVVLPPGMLEDTEAVAGWLSKAVVWTSTLPPKDAKKRLAKKKPSLKRKVRRQ